MNKIFRILFLQVCLALIMGVLSYALDTVVVADSTTGVASRTSNPTLGQLSLTTLNTTTYLSAPTIYANLQVSGNTLVGGTANISTYVNAASVIATTLVSTNIFTGRSAVLSTNVNAANFIATTVISGNSFLCNTLQASTNITGTTITGTTVTASTLAGSAFRLHAGVVRDSFETVGVSFNRSITMNVNGENVMLFYYRP